MLSSRYTLARSVVVAFSLLLTQVCFSSITVINPDVEEAAKLLKNGQREQAIEIFTMSAYEGFAASQYNLAAIYYPDRANPVSNREFRFWLNAAAESGDRDAQFNMGMVYYQDRSEFGRYDKAVKWLKEAAESGDIRAKYNLGYLSFSNLEISITRQQGVLYLQTAAQAGDARSKNLISQLQNNKVDKPPALYAVDLKLRESEVARQYVVNSDETPVYAIPVTRQSPVAVLKKGTTLEVTKVEDNWLAVRLEQGFPAWIQESQININQGIATSSGSEASLFIAPGDLQQSFKLGSIDQSEQLSVIGYEAGWVKVVAPSYFIVWIRQANVDEIYLSEADSISDSELTALDSSVQDSSPPGPGDELTSIESAASSTAARKTLFKWFPVYEAGSSNSKVLGIINKGTLVNIEETSDNFSKVTWQGGLQAWIFDKFLEVKDDTGLVIGERVRVRVSPDTGESATVVGMVERGQQFKITGSENNWYRIEISQINSGWLENL